MLIMVKRISLVLVLLILWADIAWAQRARASQEDDRAARKQWEEDQRADEYASSLRRRDWLKDRLILQLGMGSKYPIMGKEWFGFGAAVEYITKWHASAFISGGFIPASEDPIFPDKYTLDGGMGWRLGLAYYLFPKSPIHLGFQISYGTVFYDHEASPPVDGGNIGDIRSIIICRGYEFDVTISYLSDQWYFLQAIVGVYSIGNGLKDGGNTWGRTNDSWGLDDKNRIYSLVTTDASNKDQAIPPVGMVFGIGIGFAFEEFFPDDTEVRRREREAGRTKQQGQFRSSTPASKKSTPAKRNSRVDDDDEY